MKLEKEIAVLVVATVLFTGIACGYAWRMKQTGAGMSPKIRIVVKQHITEEVAEVVAINNKRVTLDTGQQWPVEEFFESWRPIQKTKGGGK